MPEDTSTPFLFPAVGRKKVAAAFDGGRITSDGGVMLLAAAERRLGIADRLAALIADPRNPAFVTHSVADILRARMLAIACGYKDADDLDHLRIDSGFKLTCGRVSSVASAPIGVFGDNPRHPFRLPESRTPTGHDSVGADKPKTSIENNGAK